MKKSLLECPVPIDQQPMNEYSNLKESIFFLWTTKDISSYIRSTIFLTVCSYVVVLTLILSSSQNIEQLQPINILAYINIFGNLLVSLYFIRLYLGWTYIYDRLLKGSISYEESGWYDGQTWVKTPSLLIRDKLVAKYQIEPVLKRIKVTLLTLCSVFILSTIHLYL